jgi:HSP20 family protein
MTDEIDRAFERIFPGVGRRSGTTDLATFSPEIDMFERDGKLVVRADLPGMTRENVTVDISEEAISIEGERKYEHEEKEEGIYHSERSYGHFSRQIPLPDGVDPDTATATFRDGVLEIALDASEMKQTRRRVEIGGETTGTKPEKAA